MLRIFISVLFLCFFNIDLQARWKTLEDSSIKVIYDNVDISIHKDYTSDTKIEFLEEILKEQGRGRYSKYIFQYDMKREKIEILEAYTIFNDKKYIVKAAEIEDKPLASVANALAEYGQISIAFPKVVVGAKIYLKYKIKTIKASIPKYFGEFISFGGGGYYENQNITINSEIPLYMHVNDPDKVLEIKGDNKKDKPSKKFTIRLKKPFISDLIDEPTDGDINLKHLTWVAVTNKSTWQGFHEEFINKYSKIINQKLPKDFEKIYEEAKKQKNEIDQINIITYKLNDTIQYLMDGRTVSGNVFPRDLSEVAKTQYGDCKDFSSVTGAILKKLGYEVDTVLVHRGEIYPEFKFPIPAFVFNHMMLKVKSKNGNVYWLDPTNFQSMAGGMFPDTAGRMALVISKTSAKYEKIPPIDPKKSNNSITKEYFIDKTDVRIVFDAKLSGQSAWNLSGIGKMFSKKSLEDIFFNNINDEKVVDPKDRLDVVIPNLESRIVSDVEFKLEYKADNLLLNTNLGKALKLRYKNLEFANNIAEDNEVDFYIGIPRSSDITTIIKSKCVTNIKNLDFNMDTKWIKLNRTASCINQDTVITDHILFKKSFIKNEEAKTEGFKKLKKAISDNYINMAVVIPNTNSH
ncbi:MAG: hypothetical protein ACI8ZF_000831 [Candidatus Midichloriaceae bacterium]|jgi:hypothetical protein